MENNSKKGIGRTILWIASIFFGLGGLNKVLILGELDSYSLTGLGLGILLFPPLRDSGKHSNLKRVVLLTGAVLLLIGTLIYLFQN